MSFKKKVDKILDTNVLGINSINGLEKEIGASTGAINKFYNENRTPGKNTVKKIKKKFNINDADWTSGEFNIGPKDAGKETPKAEPDNLHRLLLESIQAISTLLLRDDKVLDQNGKLIDQNGVLIAGKVKEVENLNRDKLWAYGLVDKLSSKLGGT
ncbi:MAG TPA: hypothetical protein VD884_13310 [Ohtaekwangia sp.]|nr:hypothetical protein [Ohtaekwangia sp.]